MLGIIFTGGEKPEADIIKRIINSADKDAIFIAADSGFDAAMEAEIIPHWVIGDMDSIKNKTALDSLPQQLPAQSAAQLPAQNVIRHKHDKDFTDTELAYQLAKEKGADKIWIIGGGGGRIDHLFGIRSMFERKDFPCRWITAKEDIYCIEEVDSGQWIVNREAIVSVFPLGDGPWQAQSSGLKWQLDGLQWNRGFFGLSNVAEDENFSINVKKGRFMIILPL